MGRGESRADGPTRSREASGMMREAVPTFIAESRPPAASLDRQPGLLLDPAERLQEQQTEIASLRNRLHSLQHRLVALEHREEGHRARLTYVNEQLQRAAAMQRALQSPSIRLHDADLDTLFLPVEEVSGDLYEIVRLDESHVALAVADATGHGLPAGLLSVFIRLALRDPGGCGGAASALRPGQVLSRVNEALLASRLEDGQFVTAIYAVYDERRHVFRFARAGAPYPLVFRGCGRVERMITQGPLLGALESAAFEVGSIHLDPGDALFLHTDGLDALSPDASHHPTKSASPWPGRRNGQVSLDLASELSSLRQLISDRRAGHEDSDDITVVAVKRHAPGTHSAMASSAA